MLDPAPAAKVKVDGYFVPVDVVLIIQLFPDQEVVPTGFVLRVTLAA